MGNDEITFMWKTSESWTGDCPAIFQGQLNGKPGYFLQVKRVTDPAVRARLAAIGGQHDSPLGADEDYGWVNADVIDRVAEL